MIDDIEEVHLYRDIDSTDINSSQIEVTNTTDSEVSFGAAGLSWCQYTTEEGYDYFLTTLTDGSVHSQWDDPRIYGYIMEYSQSIDSNSKGIVGRDNVNNGDNIYDSGAKTGYPTGGDSRLNSPRSVHSSPPPKIGSPINRNTNTPSPTSLILTMQNNNNKINKTLAESKETETEKVTPPFSKDGIASLKGVLGKSYFDLAMESGSCSSSSSDDSSDSETSINKRRSHRKVGRQDGVQVKSEESKRDQMRSTETRKVTRSGKYKTKSVDTVRAESKSATNSTLKGD